MWRRRSASFRLRYVWTQYPRKRRRRYRSSLQALERGSRRRDTFRSGHQIRSLAGCLNRNPARSTDIARRCFGYGRWEDPYWFIGPEQGQAREENDPRAPEPATLEGHGGGPERPALPSNDEYRRHALHGRTCDRYRWKYYRDALQGGASFHSPQAMSTSIFTKPELLVRLSSYFIAKHERCATSISALCSKPSFMSCSNPSFQIWCAAEHLRGLRQQPDR